MGTYLYISDVSDEQLCTLLDIPTSTLQAYAAYAELDKRFDLVKNIELQDELFQQLWSLAENCPNLQKLKNYKTFGLGKLRGEGDSGCTDDFVNVARLLCSVNQDSLVGKVKALHWG